MGCLKRLYQLVQRHVKEIAVDHPDYNEKKRYKRSKPG
jgi:hypothetical protein